MKNITAITLWIGIVLGMVLVPFVVSAQEFGSRVLANNTPIKTEVKDALVAPYLEQIEIRNTMDESTSDKPVYMKVWIMADDHQGSKIYFNQTTKKFGLARYAQGKDPFTSTTFIESSQLGEVIMAQN